MGLTAKTVALAAGRRKAISSRLTADTRGNYTGAQANPVYSFDAENRMIKAGANPALESRLSLQGGLTMFGIMASSRAMGLQHGFGA